MEDFIKRQDAIDVMYRLEAEDIETYGCSIPEGFDSKPAIEALRALPSAEPERKWIPVSERLPEEDKDVLVFGVEAISNEYVYGVKRLDVDTWRPRIAPSIRWIAWMPLPEPFGLYE